VPGSHLFRDHKFFLLKETGRNEQLFKVTTKKTKRELKKKNKKRSQGQERQRDGS
jgi:hypothetical protein